VKIADSTQDQLISCTPNLQIASLVHLEGPDHSAMYRTVDLSLWSKLKHLEFTHACLATLPSLPPTLKYLDISKNFVSVTFLPMGESIAITQLRLLETFVCDSGSLNLGVILDIIGQSVKAGNLQTLHIGSPPPGGFEGLSMLPDGFMMPSLWELSIRQCDETEAVILRLLRCCPALRYLDATSTRITGVAVKELMTREVGPLKWLGVNGCSRLSPDAVEWARSLGAVVEYNHLPPKRPAGQKFFRDRLLGTAL
jgi:F-box/TPR repeat protein Pof3